MAFSTSHCNPTPHSIPAEPAPNAQTGAPAALSRSAGRQSHHCHHGRSVGGFEVEREHRLEKLEFALAVALTRGDQGRVNSLRQQIAALGGNQEEPGT